MHKKGVSKDFYPNNLIHSIIIIVNIGSHWETWKTKRHNHTKKNAKDSSMKEGNLGYSYDSEVPNKLVQK